MVVRSLESLLEVQELLLLALADSVILSSLLALLESITAGAAASQPTARRLLRCREWGGDVTHVCPVGRTEPVSPAPMARAVVAKARVAGRVALTMDWRNMVVIDRFWGVRGVELEWL